MRLLPHQPSCTRRVHLACCPRQNRQYTRAVRVPPLCAGEHESDEAPRVQLTSLMEGYLENKGMLVDNRNPFQLLQPIEFCASIRQQIRDIHNFAVLDIQKSDAQQSPQDSCMLYSICFSRIIRQRGHRQGPKSQVTACARTSALCGRAQGRVLHHRCLDLDAIGLPYPKSLYRRTPTPPRRTQDLACISKEYHRR